MLKIGVLGAGHLGKIHLKCISQIDQYKLVGFYDPNKETAEAVANDFQICLLYTSPSPRDRTRSRMQSSA